MRKIDRAKAFIRSHSGLLICPICRDRLELQEPARLTCSKRHSFDMARTGYVNLLRGSQGSQKYGRALFEARQGVYQAGLYGPVIELLAEKLKAWIKAQGLSQLSILDMGCGEGSHLAQTAAALQGEAEVFPVGIDIAKEAIHLAAREYAGCLWCVGDLADAPFADKQFDVILSIFSPSNYKEFARLLADPGLVVKVIPGPDYLREIRIGLYGDTEKEDYSNEDVVRLFEEQYRQVRIVNLRYSQPIKPEHLPALLDMTPLTWSASSEQKERLVKKGIPEVTIDVSLLIGQVPTLLV